MGDSNLNSSIKCEETDTCKVLIIGGGIAGLAAANQLKKSGIEDFRIIEARNRIGGRVLAIPMSKHKVELGANWIHGVLGNPIFELAMSNGLVNIINVPKAPKVIAATEDGKQVPFTVLHEIHEAYQCFLRRCEEYFLCHYLPPPDVTSVGDHINLEAAIYLEKIPDSQEKKLRRLIFDCLLKRETCISGCDTMDDIDLLDLGSYTELQGGNIEIPSGYSAILEPMKKNIPSDKIITGHPVSKIVWNTSEHSHSPCEDLGEESEDSDQTVIEDTSKDPSPTRIDSPKEGCSSSSDQQQKPKKTLHNVEVFCVNGKCFKANHIICTIPLGVLKEQAENLFMPPLPSYKLESIERLSFGTVNKIFLEYERPFLNPDITEIMLLWENSTTKEDMAQCWYKKIYSFSKVTDTLLLGWISGKEAIYMESLSMDEVAQTCTKILRKFLNDSYVPEPEKCVCSSWNKQPYSKGSYTAIAVGSSQSDIESIAEPLYKSVQDRKPTLLFAGEHTHSDFYSTVHGAYLSGKNAANRLTVSDEPVATLDPCQQTSDLNAWIDGLQIAE